MKELYKKREDIRRDLARVHTKNSRTYRRLMKTLKIEANKKTREFDKKYNEKIKHQRRKFREEEKDKIKKLPKGLEGFEMLTRFDQEKFDRLVKENYEVLVIGEISIDEDEKNALRLPPKFSIMEDLIKGGPEFDQETAFAKLRMELQREIDEDLQAEDDEEEDGGDVDEEESLRMKADEMMAKSRQVYDPEEGIYDDRKKRATDLQECSKITLPKPLPPE